MYMYYMAIKNDDGKFKQRNIPPRMKTGSDHLEMTSPTRNSKYTSHTHQNIIVL